MFKIRNPGPTPSDVSLHTAPRRGGNAALLVPISTPKSAPESLATFDQKDRLPSASGFPATGHLKPVSLPNAPFTNFNRPIDSSERSSIRINSEDYSNEIEKESLDEQLFRTLATKPPNDHHTLVALPSLPENRQDYTNKPAYEPVNGPPGIIIVSSPPGYLPQNLVATTPSYLPKTSTPYFTEVICQI